MFYNLCEKKANFSLELISFKFTSALFKRYIFLRKNQSHVRSSAAVYCSNVHILKLDVNFVHYCSKILYLEKVVVDILVVTIVDSFI